MTWDLFRLMMYVCIRVYLLLQVKIILNTRVGNVELELYFEEKLLGTYLHSEYCLTALNRFV